MSALAMESAVALSTCLEMYSSHKAISLLITYLVRKRTLNDHSFKEITPWVQEDGNSKSSSHKVV